ncbi:PLP-dependent aminotransferase family protein [Caldisalinibacter kiritimatiensis]|uniref:Transcriptional regulator, GntR family domain / Aspartate aminotransferase n=1 Tax=Caldisalinibacter kiritimatiensis TaxID=1304284 RepID=R1CSK1_9FIRM|nr:PLP-dependent aminotransferase family protein [Caldisalinibacter kiritimatiensis]EOD01636.1 Transcriptional regulator, GntR family domain / Aspartate aminotransferase [Caldisalinibacter kiritimatiensis]
MDKFKNIKLNRENSQHLYIQLSNAIKKMIVTGELEPDTKLPPIRKLANKLGVNNVTIVNAYKHLENENYVYKKVGSGTFVKPKIEYQEMGLHVPIDTEFNSVGNDSKLINYDIITNDVTINFASGMPTPDLFPVSDFKKALNEILDTDKGNAFGYQESQGFYPLRCSIKNYIKSYNIDSETENIQIISGAQQGIDIISKALIDYGDVVFIESPTYRGAIASFKSRSARIIEIPIQEDGINIKSLENKLKVFTPKFIYVMPNFQNPTGYTYSNNKKEKLLDLAKKYDFYIIEDDYLSELSFNNLKGFPLKSIDKYDRVIYIKSFSKIFMPGLRLGFMIFPLSVYNDVISAKHVSDISTSGLIQRTFNLYLRKGIWQKHIQYMQTIYKKRFQIMTNSLNKYLPKQVHINLPKGGLNFWISLPNGFSSNELYNLCIKNNIVIVPGSVFYKDKNDSNYFRLNTASVYTEQIDEGIKKLSNILIQFLKIYGNKELRPTTPLL